MRRFVIVNVFLLMVVMVFSVRWASTAGPRPSQNENDDIKLAEAQVQAIAAARDSFTKHRTLNALSEPSTTITVATKRVNDSKAAVAFGIRTNNPSLASDNLEIEVNFQPVAMTSAQSLKK